MTNIAAPKVTRILVLRRDKHEPADPLPEEQEGTRAWQDVPLVAGLVGRGRRPPRRMRTYNVPVSQLNRTGGF